MNCHLSTVVNGGNSYLKTFNDGVPSSYSNGRIRRNRHERLTRRYRYGGSYHCYRCKYLSVVICSYGVLANGFFPSIVCLPMVSFFFSMISSRCWVVYILYCSKNTSLVLSVMHHPLKC